MAKILSKKHLKPDLIISSTAVRAFEIAKIIADEFDYKKKNIISTKELYLAGEREMLEVIKNVDDSNNRIFLVGHNPGITDFANSLSDYNLENLPTSGVFGIGFNTGSWKDIEYGKGDFILFDYPKKYLHNM